MTIRNRHGSYASPVDRSVFLYHSLVPLMSPPQAQRQRSYLVPTAVLFHAQTDSWVSAMDEITFAGKNEEGPYYLGWKLYMTCDIYPPIISKLLVN